jgi:hypothetical protein
MLCIKNGIGEKFPNSFEPCREYWDDVRNDDGTPYTGHWCHCSTVIAQQPPDELAILNYEIGPSQKRGKGYPVSYKKKCAGYVRKRKDFLKYVESVRKKK